MIILDSNVLSELMSPKPEARVIAWLDRQPQTSIWTTSITVFEIRFGLQVMPTGRRRDIYTQGFERLLDGIDHRIAPFDTEAAQKASSLMASRKLKGRPRELRDTMIAGIVLARHATFATRNIAHFDDVSATLIDPWAAST
ncbi:MAG TPA: type II toxin-antitoxin system VapC family toxin [Candidatus Aquilonibacter sp.]|jgi:predicted nucleic acid-binding protein|nr:type II toxin-antitoxin system VapC family toxin [Candidatus Aquilonibacter sp.]